MADISNAQLALQISNLINLWSQNQTTFQAWLAGTATGGPSSNGEYPLTDYQGNVYLVPSPASMAATINALAAMGNGAVSSATTQANASATSATSSAASASAAAASASAASTSATNAASSASSANANYNATYALWKAVTTLNTNAGNSASAAATSATEAAASSSTATTQATNSSNSATASAGSASAASTSATNAANSATAASGSASAASTSATNASNSAAAASTSASTSTTQATNAANSASIATTQATNAANSAIAAATSASSMTSSVTQSAASATAAATSATNAANSATAAATSASQAATFNPALYATLAGSLFTGTIAMSQTGVGSNSWLTPFANQQVYSVLGSGLYGPGIQARWDSATVNRYLAIGYYSQPNNGWNPTMTFQNGAVSVQGQMILGTTLTFAENVWNNTPDGVQRIYFAANADTYFESGNSVFHFRSSADADFFVVNPTFLSYNCNSSSYGTSQNTVAGLVLDNASTASQTTVEFQTAGVLRGRVRSDYVGNISYAATGSGIHAFFVGGDSEQGSEMASITSSGVTSNQFLNPAQTQSIQFASQSGQTYGSVRLNGNSNGYAGLELSDGGLGATFMSNGSVAGIYCQTTSRWSFYDSGTSFNVTAPVVNLSLGAYACVANASIGGGVVRFQSGGTPSGGNNGDITFIY